MPVKIIKGTQSAYAYPLLIKQLLHMSMATAPDQEIVYKGTRHTYRTFKERIGRLASGLARLGVEQGQTVAIMDWDSNRYLEAYFAVPMMGAILQTVNVRLNAQQILYTLNHAEADVLLINREFFSLMEPIIDRLESVRLFILLDDEHGPVEGPMKFAAEYEALLAGSDPNYVFEDFDENAQATVFYTTGTTGLPKGVGFSHRQLVLHSLGTSTLIGLSEAGACIRTSDVYMPLTPMFHVHAWGFPYIATLLGLKQVYPGRYVPASLLKLITEEKVTYSHCVPSIMQMLLSHPDSKSYDLSGWKVLIGGSAMSEALAMSAMKRGIDLTAGYGMSETCPVVTISHLNARDVQGTDEEQAGLRCMTGMPLPLVDLRIVTPEMTDVPHDGKAVGEIVLRAPWLTQEYLHAPQASEKLWAGGYLHTQDIASINARGSVKITDRLKDVIKIAGEWTSSLELEDILNGHEAVQESAVIAIPDEKWGERPLALVVLKADYADKVTEQDIRTYASHLIEVTNASRYGILLQVRFVKELMKTSVGKLNKHAMREDILGQTSEG